MKTEIGVLEAISLAKQHREITLLKIKSLIADKEMVVATANMDLTRGDQWRCDYSSWQQSINAEIAELMKELEGE